MVSLTMSRSGDAIIGDFCKTNARKMSSLNRLKFTPAFDEA